MSAVQSCLETKEMSKTNELMSSFETVDEDKDSDEESFHLFLEGDEDITKENTEEKEGNNHNSISRENNDNESLEKQNQEAEATEEPEKISTSEEIIPSNKDTSEEIQSNIQEEIQPIKEIETEKILPEDETCESTSNTENSTESMKKTEETDSKTISDSVEAEASSENEDDILNKHVSSEELSNNVEELDPNIEESLLNECDEIENEENLEECRENGPETNNIAESMSVSEVKQTEEIESVVEEKSDETVQQKSGNSENGSENVEGDKNSEKNIVANTNSQKCDDNSNSSSPDTDDLLDISMIKDSAQDDADIAEDALQLEQENDDSSSKGVENVDNVDDTSNSENSDEEGKEESETSENVQTEISDSEKEKDVQDSDKEEAINKIDETPCENIEKNGDNAGIVDSVSSENCEQQTDQTPKRNLSSSDSEPASKRIKLVDTNTDDTEMDSEDIIELQNLISFSQFMTKSHLKKLTRGDLEEFCIQKLCEAILHKSELGETNHQLKILEQTIETLRRDQAVVTKQIKDLEIVNKKLMHEILSANGTKPILPVKITRSVGLQVRLPLANDPSTVKRRTLPSAQPKTPVIQNQVSTPKVRTPAISTPNRSLTQPSPQKQTTPILTQALQNRNRTPVKTPQLHNNTTQRPNISPKPVPEKRARTSSSFIDLTDEDDKKANNKNLKSILPQGVRINSVPKTTVSSVMPSVVSTTTPQVMYVVQQNSQIKQGVLATHGQKAVLVNFQPTNGVLNNLNSSSVSVIPKVSTNVPIKAKPSPQNSVLKVAKHPAPLPSPPAVQGPNDKSLKAIPPKPVLSIRKTNTGIILQWRMPYDLGNYESIASYQLYAYQETSAVPSTDMWRKVGDVKAMALPMACTLTQFADKNKYYFAVRPVDIHKRIGKFSHPVLSE